MKPIRYSAAGLLLVLLSGISWSADQAQINQAVARGGKFLQGFTGQPAYSGGTHGVGAAALSGLALLEADVPITDPSLQNIARLVRSAAPTENRTYNIALSIIFLDRLGQKEDVLALQILGVRLYSGLTSSGGWTYNCGADLGGAGLGGFIPGNRGPAMPGNAPGVFPPGFNPPPNQAGVGPNGASVGNDTPITGPIPPRGMPNPPGGARPDQPPLPDNGFPQPQQPGGKKGGAQVPDNGFPQAPAPKANNNPNNNDPEMNKLLPAAAQYYSQVRAMLRGGRVGGDGDNSNTQFGLIALWIASRHGVPANDAFALIEARFLTTQHRGTGGWGYTSADTHATPSMTCAGLLGLAIGAARSTPAPNSTPKSSRRQSRLK
jgi:hypothetical protein